MKRLKVTSNSQTNSLAQVGEIKLQGGNIILIAEKNTTVSLIRKEKNAIIILAKEVKQTAKGKAEAEDVYIFDNNNQRLTARVELENYDMFIKNEPSYDASNQKRKVTLTIGVLILILLIISVLFGVKQKNKKEFEKVSKEKTESAIVYYEKAINEATINIFTARESFVLAKKNAEELINSNYKSARLTQLMNNISSQEAEILGEKNIDLKEFIDLTLQTSGFNGNRIVSSGDEMFVFDQKQRSVIGFQVDGKNAKKVAGQDTLEGALEIASYENRVFSLNDDGIYEISKKREKIKEKDWGNSFIYLYSNNIYLVDVNVNQIYRFAGNKNVFSDKQEWLAPGIEADFSKIIDITIDGSIWLLSSSGKVTRFVNGNPTNILMQGIVDPIVNPTAIYTNEKLNYVYILESQKERVVVLNKDGTFKMQYKSTGIKEAVDLVASKEKIILLTGPKLMTIDSTSGGDGGN